MERALSFQQAKAAYGHRYTMEHVPDWAKRPLFHPDRKTYVYCAPQFRTDREWYEATRFKGEDGWIGIGSDCYTTGHTWPLGEGFLAEPFHLNRNQVAS